MSMLSAVPDLLKTAGKTCWGPQERREAHARLFANSLTGGWEWGKELEDLRVKLYRWHHKAKVIIILY